MRFCGKCQLSLEGEIEAVVQMLDPLLKLRSLHCTLFGILHLGDRLNIMHDNSLQNFGHMLPGSGSSSMQDAENWKGCEQTKWLRFEAHLGAARN